MSDESGSIWQALLSSGEYIATDADYEHGYDRRIREDLVRVVTFRVGDERHAVPIRQVREITRCFGTTPVPRTNDYITGVGTLRGELVPVLCLATRLGMAPGPVTRNSRIVLVTLDENIFGLQVDSVDGVMAIPPESLREPPSVLGGGSNAMHRDFVFALAREETGLVIVLNIATVVVPADFVHPRFRGSEVRR